MILINFILKYFYENIYFKIYHYLNKNILKNTVILKNTMYLKVIVVLESYYNMFLLNRL